jgi:YgiT-type zinc finger domain-containing protein
MWPLRGYGKRRQEEIIMKCHSPECTGEQEAGTISHEVVYRERTFVIHQVPADVCPECGEAVLSQETVFQIDGLLSRQARSKKDAFVYEV